MMQTDSASTDEDIGGRKEKDAQDENEAGRAVCFPILAPSRPPGTTRGCLVFRRAPNFLLVSVRT